MTSRGQALPARRKGAASRTIFGSRYAADVGLLSKGLAAIGRNRFKGPEPDYLEVTLKGLPDGRWTVTLYGEDGYVLLDDLPDDPSFAWADEYDAVLRAVRHKEAIIAGPTQILRTLRYPGEAEVLVSRDSGESKTVPIEELLAEVRGMSSRAYYEEQFDEARKQWGPGTDAYKRRKRRKKNPAPECPEMPEKLTAASVKKTVDTLNMLNGKVIADLRSKDMKRAAQAAKATTRFQHEAFATLFFQCDMRAGRDQKAAWARMLTFIEKHYGKPFVANVEKVVPLILKGARFGTTPHSVQTRALYDALDVEPRGELAKGELAKAIPQIQGILDTRNRAKTSSRRFKQSTEAVEWTIRRQGKDFVEMEHAYAPEMMRRGGQFGVGVTPWNPTLSDLTAEDKITLVLHAAQKAWAYYMTATCDIDGEPVRSAYRMVPEGKTISLPGLREVQGSLGFVDLDAALDALPGILDSLDDFTYAHVCDDKPLALQEGDRMQFDLQHGKRLPNPGLLIPMASVLVTAVGLGDSLFELHSALT